jgi:hypothetical protein
MKQRDGLDWFSCVRGGEPGRGPRTVGTCLVDVIRQRSLIKPMVCLSFHSNANDGPASGTLGFPALEEINGGGFQLVDCIAADVFGCLDGLVTRLRDSARGV